MKTLHTIGDSHSIAGWQEIQQKKLIPVPISIHHIPTLLDLKEALWLQKKRDTEKSGEGWYLGILYNMRFFNNRWSRESNPVTLVGNAGAYRRPIPPNRILYERRHNVKKRA